MGPTRDFLPPPGIGFLALFEDGELRRKLDEGLTRDLEPRDMVERLYVTDVAHCVWEAARARSAATEILNTEITRQSFEAYVGGQCVGEERRRGPLSDSDRLELRGEAGVEFQAILSRATPRRTRPLGKRLPASASRRR